MPDQSVSTLQRHIDALKSIQMKLQELVASVASQPQWFRSAVAEELSALAGKLSNMPITVEPLAPVEQVDAHDLEAEATLRAFESVPKPAPRLEVIDPNELIGLPVREKLLRVFRKTGNRPMTARQLEDITGVSVPTLNTTLIARPFGQFEKAGRFPNGRHTQSLWKATALGLEGKILRDGQSEPEEQGRA